MTRSSQAKPSPRQHSSGQASWQRRANAAVEHCPDQTSNVLIGGGSTVNVLLAEGTVVCIKAGTRITFVEVQGGYITNTTILNKNDRPRYYEPGGEPEPAWEPTYWEPCEKEPPTEC